MLVFDGPAGYMLVSWLFLRLLGVVYLVAFASFAVQALGLIGAHGILPAREYLPLLRRALGKRAYLLFPSVVWLNAGNLVLLGISWAGALLGLLLLFGLSTTWVLLLAWILYLSLVAVAQEFLGYQWDALLLEAGFLAVFLAPTSLLPAPGVSPSLPVVFLFRWLLFRLMFMSGLMKLVSRDPTWRNLTAMTYHYETQPLPTPLAWYAFRAPLWFHKLSSLASLAIELVVPFFFFAPAPLRLVAAALTVLLQLLILLTGNFAFFNLLTIFLAVFLLDDGLLRPVFSVGRLALPDMAGSTVAWGNLVPLLLATALVLLGLLHILRPLVRGRYTGAWRRVQPVLAVVEAFRLSNSYGLFAVMTTRRPEIVVEGSDDMQSWLPYEFKYKPGDPRRPPRFVAPHQPRLDWQMWFAALGDYLGNIWMLAFLERLLDDTPEVLALLARNPFPAAAPRYLRAVLYDYHFTSPEERALTGAWWRRELLGPYTPIVSRRQDLPPDTESGDERWH